MSAQSVKQIPLDLTHLTAYGREDFLIAPCNEEAVKWIDLWPDWPAPAFILYGAEASGKTHLSYVWQEKTNALRVPVQDLEGADFGRIFDRKAALIIEDVQASIGDKSIETALFHLYNLAKEKQASILLTSKDVQTSWDFTIPDLRSRLCAAPSVSIYAPDEDLLQLVLVKMFMDRQLELSQEVVNYIIPRAERSFGFIRRLVARADALALAEKKAITIPIVKKAFENLS